MNQHVTEIQGRSFKLNESLLQQVRQAKNLLEPKREREIRLKQLTTHLAECPNHSNSW